MLSFRTSTLRNVFRKMSRAASTTSIVPDKCENIVVGGGVIGASIAYHLAKMGKDVLLLERDTVTSGTTWHAAGLMVTFGSLSETSTELRKYSKELYSNLEEETGQSTGIKKCGFIEVATSKDRLEEFRRVAAFNRYCGVDVNEISASEVQTLFPLAKTDDIFAGFYVPDDGRVNPVDVTMALIKGAKMHGAKVVEGVPVRTISQSAGLVNGVILEDGRRIEAEKVANCAGMWARQLGERSGVLIPNQAAEHYYLVTDKMDDVDPDWPVLEDPSSYTYIRPEGAGLMIGLFEPEAAAWNVDSIPNDVSYTEIEPDFERMAPFLEKAMSRVPATLNVPLKKFFCGPESFTPDLSPIVGESKELRNYFICAGLNSIGILSGGGLGRIMAQWMTSGKPDVDVTGFNADRFHKHQLNPRYRQDRVEEMLGQVYKCHYPTWTPRTCRGAKRSPIHDRLLSQGAQMKDVSGWESPAWFGKELKSYSFGKESNFESWREEHEAVRNNVGLVDMSFMSKFRVTGKDAGTFLNYISTNDVNPENHHGVITYTQFLNESGTLEADLTVTKTEQDKFMVIATDTMHHHVETWIRRRAEDMNVDVNIQDITGTLAQLNIQGPNSRKLMEKLTSVDMSNESFPFRAARDIDIEFARCLCCRITYLGELGYELFIPSEMALHVYERILEQGKDFGLRHVGLKALGSLRLEKGYRDYGHDMDNLDTPLEVGLGFSCDLNKKGGFLGREHVISQKQNGGVKALSQRLVHVLLHKNPDIMMHHAEIVYRNGIPCGDVRAASYGHTLGGSVGLAMVSKHEEEPFTKKHVEHSKWEIDVAGTRYPAKVSLSPMYDPKNLRIKL